MKFYGYIETSEGKEPIGSEGRILFELGTVPGAIRRVRRFASLNSFEKGKFQIPHVARLFSYTNFYDQKTFKQLI